MGMEAQMHIKLRSTPAIFLILLSFGLASCAPDQPKVDVFKVSAPSIHQANGQTLGWSEMGRAQPTTLSTSDSLKFGQEMASPTVTLSVSSSCSFKGAEVRTHSTWLAPKELSLLQILPRAVILSPPSPAIPCTIHFIARNENGSTHLFDLPKFLVLPTVVGTDLQIKKDGAFLNQRGTEIETIVLTEWSHYFAVQPPGGRLDLECERHRIPSLSHQDVTSFVKFDATRATSFEPKTPLATYPTQYCRVIQFHGEQRLALSPLLRIEFPSARLEVASRMSKKFDFDSLAQIHLRNPNLFAITLRLPAPANRKLLVRYFTDSEFAEGLSLMNFADQDGSAFPEVFAVEPESEITLNVKMKRLACTVHPSTKGFEPPYGGIWLAAPQMIALEIVQVATKGEPSISDGQSPVKVPLFRQGPLASYGFENRLTDNAVPFEDVRLLKNKSSTCR